MPREYHGFTTTIVNNDGRVTVFEEGLVDSILFTLPRNGRFSVSIAHENSHGFAKQVANFRTCSGRLGGDLLIHDDGKSVTLQTNSFAIGAWFAYSAALCAVVPGHWPDYTDFVGASKRLLKNYIPGDFQKFATTGICNSPTMRVTDPGKLDEVDAVMCATKADIAARLGVL